MWAEVEEIIEEYKRDTWKRLADSEQNENFMDLIGYNSFLWPFIEFLLTLVEHFWNLEYQIILYKYGWRHDTNILRRRFMSSLTGLGWKLRVCNSHR